MARRTRRVVSIVAVLAVLGGMGVAAYVVRLQKGAVSYSSPQPARALRTADLASLRDHRVFFGHQSVGANILDGLRGLYAEKGEKAPTIKTISGAGDLDGLVGGFLAERKIGKNGAPETKIAEFDRLMRSGLSDKVDVALMKLCYVDFRRTTDPTQLFARYRETMAQLERDFPHVAFVYTTAPLVSSKGFSDSYVNSLRTQFNSLVRTEVKNKRLLDIAALESADQRGGTHAGSLYGFTYEAMRSEYTSDGGHLNPTGAQRVAQGFVGQVVR